MSPVEQRDGKMLKIRTPLHSELEELIVAEDEEEGFHAVVAIHSTLLGPAIGGARFRPYYSEREALEDAARIAPYNSFRAALANIPFGGSSIVLIETPGRKTDRRGIFRAFGRLIDSLEGRVIAAEDLGVGMEELSIINEITPFACGGSRPGPGDSSYFTALGVLRGIEACIRHAFNENSLHGLTVAVLGIGHVGMQLCEMLSHAGVKLLVADLVPEKRERAAEQFGATILDSNDLRQAPCDIFCPCAVGRVLDDETILDLKCRIVAGAAGAQLVQPNRHGRLLYDREIVYAPDFAINVGGLYASACELHGYDGAQATVLVNGVYDTVERILEQSQADRKPTYTIALRMAQDKLRKAKARNILAHV